NLDYDAGTTIGINAGIDISGTADIDSTGVTTIAAAGNITADGAVTFGAALTGQLTTSGDIVTSDDNVTFTRAVTLGGNVDIDTTGTTAGNILFSSTVATGGHNLSLDGGENGNITLSDALTGGGDVVVRDGNVQSYQALTVHSLDIQDATTSVTFGAAVAATTTIDVLSGGTIVQNGAVTSGTNLDYDANGTIGINDGITISGTADIDSTGVTTIAAAGDITADGAVTFGATLTGQLTTSGDIVTSDDNVTFTRPVTLGGDVVINSDTGPGNITFSSTVDGNNILTLSAGTGILNINGVVGGNAALNHVRLMSAGNFTSTATLIDMSNQDLYIDADGYTIELLLDLSVKRFVFYSGTLDFNGNTITTESDFVAYGSAYDDEDGERTSTPDTVLLVDNTFFAYPDESGLLMALPGTLNAAFGDMNGATIDVSTNGNFYLNGADMNNGGFGNTGDWTLKIRDNSGTTNPVLDTDPGDDETDWPFGSIYAAAFNADVDHCQASGGTVMADTANGVTDGGNNLNWDFSHPYITNYETIFDNVIRVTFSEAIENSNDEISTAVAASGVWTNVGATAFTETYVDNSDGTTDAVPYNFTSTDGEGDLTTFYLFVPRAALTWNTDATGTSAGAAGSSDRDGNHQTTIADLSMLKGVFFDAAGHNLVQNYGENGVNECDGTGVETFTDKCRPALIAVAAGRADHQVSGSDEIYDAHNMFHLRYSEPVNIGDDLDYAIGAGTPPENDRAEETFGAGEHGGHMLESGSDVLVEGYFTYPGIFKSGSKDGNDAINSIYRGGAENPSGDYGLTIFVAGYRTANTVPFPGYLGDPDETLSAHTPNTDPVGLSASAVDNSYITDADGNAVEPSDETYRSFTSPLTASDESVDDPVITDIVSDMAPGVAAGITMSGAVTFHNGWDVDPPTFSEYVDGDAAIPETGYYEIVSDIDGATGLINVLEFFIRDNESGQIGWVSTGAGEMHLDHENMHGVRDSSYANYDYGLGLVQPYLAIEISDINDDAHTSDNNAGFDTMTFNNIFSDTAVDELVNEADDPYFALNINNFGHSWDSLTSLEIKYDANAGLITDLAGNIIYSVDIPIAGVERILPVIDLALASVGDDKIYVQFSEPVFGVAAAPIDENDFTFDPLSITITSIEPISYYNGGITEAWFHLSSELTADIAFSGKIIPVADQIYDQVSNIMSDTATHRATDIGLGLMEPVWAMDDIHNDSLYGDVDNSLRDFDGTGYLTDSDITIEASIAAESYTGLSTSLYYDVEPDDSVVSSGFWLPTYNNAIVPDSNEEARSVLAYRSTGSVRDYLLPSEDSEIESGAEVEFLLKLGDLFCAQLLDSTDPRTLLPWSFIIKDVTRQAAGVNIMNNIINPENGEKTIINYEIAEAGMVVINVFNLGGDLVDVIHRGAQGSGNYSYTWDGRNRAGNDVARGVYFIRVVGPDIDEFRKVMVVK
ncbi:MAG: FlgD immunoglobulin-like domain containing protein, partial [Spirochaetales bacterium]|nr:FlgD immunoglobulin-like domain containing protein [Spirochaetales bacterium]